MLTMIIKAWKQIILIIILISNITIPHFIILSTLGRKYWSSNILHHFYLKPGKPQISMQNMCTKYKCKLQFKIK